jgi:hypothetical protein
MQTLKKKNKIHTVQPEGVEKRKNFVPLPKIKALFVGVLPTVRHCHYTG